MPPRVAVIVVQDEEALAKKGVTRDTFEFTNLTWSVVSASGALVPLREGGTDEPVAWSEREQYAHEAAWVRRSPDLQRHAFLYAARRPPPAVFAA